MRPPFSALTLAVVGGTLAAAMASMLGAQTRLRFQYQRWGNPNRYEGVQVGHQVAGERLELVSAIARCQLQPSQNPDRVSVGFSSNEAADVSIAVRDLEQNYWMEPIDEQGNKIFKARSGFNSFTWQADNVNYIQRTSQDLYALVERRGDAHTYVLPAIVFDSGTRLPLDVHVNDYEFAFLPHAEADLSYRVQSGNGAELKSGELLDLPEGHVRVVRWEPISQPDGVYQLVGTATFHFKSGAKVQQQIYINFYHVSVIHMM